MPMWGLGTEKLEGNDTSIPGAFTGWKRFGEYKFLVDAARADRDIAERNGDSENFGVPFVNSSCPQNPAIT
ncbi:hypothetical protein Tco_0248526, partial [Tanacetum coccineum]